MPHDFPPLDYGRAPTRSYVRHAIIVAAICLAAVCVDLGMGHDAPWTQNLGWFELVLAVLGAVFAVHGLASPAMPRSKKMRLVLCMVIFACAVYVAVLMPRGLHRG
jgi:hypothetical protein